MRRLQWTYSYFTYKLGSRIVFGLENSEGALAASVAPQDSTRQPGEMEPAAFNGPAISRPAAVSTQLPP